MFGKRAGGGGGIEGEVGEKGEGAFAALQTTLFHIKRLIKTEYPILLHFLRSSFPKATF